MRVKIVSRLFNRVLKDKEPVYHPVLGVGLAKIQADEVKFAIPDNAWFRRGCDSIDLLSNKLRVEELREICIKHVSDVESSEGFIERLDPIFWKLAYKRGLVDSGKAVNAYISYNGTGAILLPVEEGSDGR